MKSNGYELPLSLAHILLENASRYPSRKAFVTPDIELSYKALLDESLRVAKGIIALGVAPRSHVGILATNGAPLITAIFGSALANCVAVPLSARHKRHELGYIIENADIEVILTSAADVSVLDFRKTLSDALPDLNKVNHSRNLNLTVAPRLKHIVLLDGTAKTGFMSRSEFDTLATNFEMHEVEARYKNIEADEAAVIIYTSGTTANPKGCLLSHNAITSGPIDRANKRLRVKPYDVTWGGGPLFHIGSLAPFIGSIGTGGTYLTDVVFTPDRALDLMMTENVTVAWPWFPAILQPLLSHPNFSAQALSTLQKVMIIGPEALIRHAQKSLPHTEFIQACGMTETAGIFAISGPEETLQSRATSNGRAVPGVEVKIIDPENGRDTPIGEVGEILVKGPCVMDGYYRSPEKTREALDPDGWLHTGDLYSMTEDGRLRYNGRLKDMLKVGGENVAAIEIESFLSHHPAVKTAEVVGREDERLDEVPVAFVELCEGFTASEAELLTFCKGEIASYKIPREFIFMKPGEWPMSETKVNKRKLRERLAQKGRLALD